MGAQGLGDKMKGTDANAEEGIHAESSLREKYWGGDGCASAEAWGQTEPILTH